MPLINTTDALVKLCTHCAEHPFIAVDTEFLRDKYYYPKLCLVQIAYENHCFLIDPLAPNLDLTPLWQVFKNPKIIKVFHSARQDIETVYHMTGRTITPIFDTQIAAMVLGYHDCVSYANLTYDLLGVKLNKSSQFSAWDNRPLTDQQMSYARADVIYLYQLFPLLHAKLKKQKRLSWIKEELTTLEDPATYHVDPNHVWKRIGLRHKSPQALALLKLITHWRELEAQRTNLPRSHVLKDSAIQEICKIRPKQKKSLLRIAHTSRLSDTQQDLILSYVKQSQSATARDHSYTASTVPTTEEKTLIDMLRLALQALARKHQVAEQLVISPHEFMEFALTNILPEKLTHGWRSRFFGKQLVALKKGKSYLHIYRNQVRLKRKRLL